MHEEIIFQQIGSPVFQNKVYPTAEAARRAVLGDVELVQSSISGLVHNRNFDPSLVKYDADYQNEQACSVAFRCHLDHVLGIVLPDLGHDKVGVEIGCGKGHFLELLCNAGANVTGFDPAYEGSNSRVVKKYFGEESIITPPDYVILRHVLEHLPNPWSFLTQLGTQCKVKTKIYIEVPCFEWIVEHQAFYDIFYEHVNYFTLNVLRRAFDLVTKSGNFFGGQYLFLVADLSTFRAPERYAGRRFGKLDMNRYLHTLLRMRSGSSGKTFIWGAGAKGITLSNIFRRNAIPIDAIIDINPAKQGMFAGGSGLPIIGPDAAMPQIGGADVFVMNPVYLSEIHSSLSDMSVNLISVA
jgi:hypothetical protein